jgi:hypothetical protein
LSNLKSDQHYQYKFTDNILYNVEILKQITKILRIAKEYCKHPCLLFKLEVYPPEAAPKATTA